jgi:DNA polymerase
VQLQNLPQNHLPDLFEARSLVAAGDMESLGLLYDSVPDVLSELIRTAFVPMEGKKFVVADFSAIEARVIAWLAGESWRSEVFASGKDIYCESASRMFGVPVEKHGVNGHLRQKGKVAELALGYGGGVGALKAMGALEMGVPEEELQGIVTAWRNASPNIVRFWWNVDAAVKTAIRARRTVKLPIGSVSNISTLHSSLSTLKKPLHSSLSTLKKPLHSSLSTLEISCRAGMLFIELPSGRSLCYVRPRLTRNRFGGESIEYLGIGPSKKWERIESYGPKFVENIVQGISRDLLAEAMIRLSASSPIYTDGPKGSGGDRKAPSYRIVAHVHDEVIIEADHEDTVNEICDVMSQCPPWAEGLLLRADGYECTYYRKD